MEAIDTRAAVIDRMTLHKPGGGPPPPPTTLQLAQPLGGETYRIGSQLAVHWTSTQNLGPVRIELSRTGAAGPWETLFASTSDDGEEIWNVTGPESPNCLLRVAAADDGFPHDQTATVFGIELPPDSGEDEVFPDIFGISFQPATSPVPANYVSDLGLPFDEGESYGWLTTMTMRSRGVVPGNVHDSFVDVQNNETPGVWEIALANGSYRVSLVCGDPITTATHRVAIEGQIVIHDEPTIATQYIERSDIPVLVTDGRLTMTVGGSGDITFDRHRSGAASAARAAVSGGRRELLQRRLGADPLEWSDGGSPGAPRGVAHRTRRPVVDVDGHPGRRP
jgi:hypothetical protein